MQIHSIEAKPSSTRGETGDIRMFIREFVRKNGKSHQDFLKLISQATSRVNLDPDFSWVYNTQFSIFRNSLYVETAEMSTHTVGLFFNHEGGLGLTVTHRGEQELHTDYLFRIDWERERILLSDIEIDDVLFDSHDKHSLWNLHTVMLVLKTFPQ